MSNGHTAIGLSAGAQASGPGRRLKVKKAIRKSGVGACRMDTKFRAAFGHHHIYVLIAILLCAGMAAAQVGSASLSGIVQDPSGASVAGATVILQNVLNGEPRTVKSNGTGGFSFAALPSGDYNLKVEREGFTTYVQQGIHLDPGDSRTLTDVKLAVGSESQTVTVEAAISGIQLDSGQLSATVTAQD